MSPKISVYNKQKILKISAKSVKAVVKATLSFYNVSYEEIAVHYVSASTICKLHKEFFNDPTMTDCISFPYDEDSFLGEVFVCPKAAMDYVEKKGIDVYEEVMLYTVHGLLHLIGYDDIDPTERKKMKKEEKRAVKFLKNKSLMIHP